MIETDGLRAEDFRKAWPNAYQQAILQVMVLHESATNLQTTMTKQTATIKASLTAGLEEMVAMRAEILEELKQANRDHQISLQRNIKLQRDEFEKLIQKQEQLKKLVASEKNEIHELRRAAQNQLNKFRNASLATRMLWAITPNRLQRQ